MPMGVDSAMEEIPSGLDDARPAATSQLEQQDREGFSRKPQRLDEPLDWEAEAALPED